MRLTLINQFYVPDLAPTGHMAASLADHRAGLGDQVTVVTSTGGYVPQSPIETGRSRSNPSVHRLWTPRAGKGSSLTRALDYTSFYVLAALRVVSLPRQDVIVALTTPPFIAWTAVLHKLLHRSTQIVLWNMDCYPEIAEQTGVIRRGGAVSRLMRWLNRRLFSHLSAVVSLDQAMESLLRESYAPAKDPVDWVVIPNWEPFGLFPPDGDAPVWQGKTDLELDGRFVILYLGNAGFGHRFETVLDAAERLSSEDIAWVFVGGGRKWPWLENEAHRRHLLNVYLCPYVDKGLTPGVLAAADCGLITMNESAVGLVSPSKLHSNLAMGLPILYIGPQGGNVHDAIQRFGVGASLREGDVTGVVDFVRELRTHEDVLARFRARARRAFEEAYSDNVTLPQFDQLLDRVPNL